MVPLNMLDMVSYYCLYSNFVCRRHRFRGIRLQKCRDLEDRLGVRESHWKCHNSIESLWLFYWCCIVTVALSRVVSEIFNVEKYRDLEIMVKGQSRSLNVVPYDKLGMVSY